MKHPNEIGTHKVVMSNGAFFAAPVADTQFRETRASTNERSRLVRTQGLQADGSFPGLVKWYALRMARQMDASRRRNSRQRRRA